jgi:methionyl-tRNA formyltransferase
MTIPPGAPPSRGVEAARPLRIVLLTRDALYPRDFLRGLLGGLLGGVPSHPFEIVGVGLSGRALRRGRPGWVGAALDTAAWVRVVGVRYAAYMGWVAGVAPTLLRVGPSPRGVAAGVLGRGVGGGAPVARISDVNAPEVQGWIRGLAADLILSVHWNQWIAPETAALARLGGVNLHPSRLPAYRGVDPVHVALRAGEQVLGVTLHRIAPEIDTGAVLAQRTLDVRPGGRIANNRALFFVGGRMLRGLLDGEPGGLLALERALEGAWAQPTEGASHHGWRDVR